MGFWGTRRGASSSATVGSSAVELIPDVAPIQVFLADRIVTGHIATEGERITDLLAERRGLRVQLEDGTWEQIDVDDIRLVAPPPHASKRRIHRSKHRVQLLVPPYKVMGVVHLPPGTQLDPFVLRTGRLVLPVTGAWLLGDGDPSVDQQLDVAILAVHAIETAKELLYSL